MSLNPGEVKTEHIAAGAVTTPKLADGAVSTAKLQGSSVTTEKIANNALTSEKIATGQVTVDKLSSGAVTTPKIATASVTTDKLPDGAVATGKLKDGAVTGPKIGALQVGTAKLRDRAVTTPKIADGAVTPAKLSFTPPAIARPITPPLTSVELGTNSVETAKIKAGAVTPAKLSFIPVARPLVPPIVAAEIATDAVETAKIKDKAVTGAKIKDYDIGYTQIASNSINREKIINGEVTPQKLEAVDTPADTEVPSYDSASGKFKWVTPTAPPTAPIGLFVPRSVSTPDFTIANFTTDGSWKVNGLNLSSIVPSGAIAVLLRFEVRESTGGLLFYIGQNASYLASSLLAQTQVANRAIQREGILPIDADRLMDYYGSSALWAALDVFVAGWFI